MERITNFIYCLNVANIQNEQGTTLNANGILATLLPEFIPGMFSFSIVFTILGLKEKTYDFGVLFKDPEGNVVVDTGVVSVPFKEISLNDKNKVSLPDEEKGLTLSLDLKNVILKTNGYYSTNVFCDGKNLGEFKIYAKGKNT